MSPSNTYSLNVQFDADQRGNRPVWKLVDGHGRNVMQKEGPNTGELLLGPGAQLSIVVSAIAEKGSQTTGASLENVALITLPRGVASGPSMVQGSPYSVLQLGGQAFTASHPASSGWQTVFTLTEPLQLVGEPGAGDQGVWELSLIVNATVQGEGPNARQRVLRFDPEVKVGEQR